MLTKEELLNPERQAHPVPLAEFKKSVLLATPSGFLSLRLRDMKARGVKLESEEALVAMAADMVVDEHGAPMLTPEEAPRFLGRLSLASLTAIIVKFGELVAQEKAADAVPSKPSTSA